MLKLPALCAKEQSSPLELSRSAVHDLQVVPDEHISMFPSMSVVAHLCFQNIVNLLDIKVCGKFESLAIQ